MAGLALLDATTVAALGVGGSLSLYGLGDGSEAVLEMATLAVLEGEKGAAVAATPGGPQGAVAGEGGSVAVVDWKSGEVVAMYGGGPLGTPLEDVAWVGGHEVVTVGSQVERWDVRADPQDGPVLVMKDVSAASSLHTLALHPNQPEFMATGASDGIVAVWDVRAAGWAVSNVRAHQADIWDLEFHPLHPDFLFSASDDGTVLRWNFNATKDRSRVSFAFHDDSNMAIDQIVDSMLPVNSITVSPATDTLVCGADNGLVIVESILPSDIL